MLGQLGDDKATINGFEAIMGDLRDELNSGFGRQAANDIADAKGNVDKMAHLETLKSDIVSPYKISFLICVLWNRYSAMFRAYASPHQKHGTLAPPRMHALHSYERN